MFQAVSTFDVNKIRNEFPVLNQVVNGKPLTYLDNAATSQKPRSVLEIVGRYYREDNANVHRGIHELSRRATLAFEGARTRIAEWLGAADPSEIIWTRGTTEGINLVAADTIIMFDADWVSWKLTFDCRNIFELFLIRLGKTP